MWTRRTMLSALCTAMVMASCACGGSPTTPSSSATTAVGTTPPHRVVVLDPGIAEVFVHLNMTDKMVGRPGYTDHLQPIAHIPTMGTGITPQYEHIVRTNPDLIMTTGSGGKVLDDLKNIAATQKFDWLRVSEVVEGTRAIGERMGKPDEANALANQIAEGLRTTATTDSPRVLLLLGAPSETATELWYVKKDSLHGAALAAAGGNNAVTQSFSGPPSLSIEALLKIDPDIILVMTPDATSTDIAAHMSYWKRFEMLRAVHSGRIGFLTGEEHFSTGPGVLQLKVVLQQELERHRDTTP